MKGTIMNDYTEYRADFITERFNKLAHESGSVLAGLYDNISRPLTMEEKMDIRRLLNEYAATAYLLDIESRERAAQKNKKSFLKKLFKRKN